MSLSHPLWYLLPGAGPIGLPLVIANARDQVQNDLAANISSAVADMQRVLVHAGERATFVRITTEDPGGDLHVGVCPAPAHHSLPPQHVIVPIAPGAAPLAKQA